MKLVFATGNPDKLKEIKQIMRDLPLKGRINISAVIPDVREDGVTLLENALIKAKAGFEKTNIPSIGEDTGLIVDALDGSPGIFSSRFAGEKSSYTDNLTKLISLVKDFSLTHRKARFVCYMAYYDGKKTVWVKGQVSGFIITEPRGEYGFGYDPVFLYPKLGLTFAEMPPELKNKLSHRKRALESLFYILGLLK